MGYKFGVNMGLLQKVLKRRLVREPRVQIQNFHKIKLEVADENSNFIEYKVNNVSITGISFFADNAKKQFIKNSTRPAKLEINQTSYDVELRVVWAKDNVVGLEMMGPSDELMMATIRYFRFEVMAQKIHYEKVEPLKPDSDGDPYLLKGGEKFELFYVINEEKIVKFRLTILGTTVEKNREGKVEIIDLWDEKAHEKVGLDYKGSELIKKMDLLMPEYIDNAVRFLTNVHELSEENALQICRELETLRR